MQYYGCTKNRNEMKIGVVVFPGSNCDADMQQALSDVLDTEVVMLWHKNDDLSAFTSNDCIVLPGGFSYGDYLRCGAIAQFSPMMQSVIKFAHHGGKVLGVCNGFQILCEAKLLPGVLLPNAHQQFVCKNVYIKNQTENKVLKIPVAHGDGRYYANEKTLLQLNQNNQVLYQYCDIDGNITPEGNPNGSLQNIAAISNIAGNVVGMMPHPERACSTILGNVDGIEVFTTLGLHKIKTTASL